VIRTLFLSASVGDGHSSAANAVCAALDDVAPGSRSLVVDSYRYAALVVSRVVSSGYLQMVQTIPQMYRYLYDRAERATEIGPFRTWAHQFTAGNLRGLIQRERPDVVVCTHAFPCGAMAEYKAAYPDSPPIVGIVTDFAVHGFWAHADVDGYAVATESMRAALAARGIPADRVLTTGIPVHPRFVKGAEPKQALRARLGLPEQGRVVLLMGGGLGIGPLERMMQALERVDAPVAAVAIAGRNGRTERRARAAAQTLRSKVNVVGFVENVYDYMHACDVLVTKPGGLTAAEALVAGIPMVLCHPLPGQEERNARFLVEGGSAVRVRRLEDLPSALSALLSDADRREHMTAAAAALGKPHAARDVGALIARLARMQQEDVA
jgi:processive 1,2-diacylglycerol beta-glucosyltransferase